MAEFRIIDKEEFTTRFLADQEKRKEKKKMEEVKEVKTVKKIAPPVDKTGAKKEKAEINNSIEFMLRKDFTVKVQPNGEILIRGLNADYSVKVTQKKDRLPELE